MLDAGDLDGVAVWRRIIRAIEELQRKAPGRQRRSVHQVQNQAAMSAKSHHRTFSRLALNVPFGS